MERILVTFGFILILETVRTVSTTVLLLGLMHPEIILRIEFLRLLRAAFAYVHALKLRQAALTRVRGTVYT